MTGFVVFVGSVIGVGVSTFPPLSVVGETEGEGEGVLVAETVAEGVADTVAVGVVLTLPPAFA